jgi:hypothetical protein
MESFRQHNSLRDHNRKQAFVDNLQKSLVGEFEISDNDTNLEKALDLTHGGRLVPKHIIDANGHKRLVYVLPEEITHRHEALKAGDKFKTKNGEEHELVREKGHDNKGGHLVTLKDKTGRIHDKYIHNLESVENAPEQAINQRDETGYKKEYKDRDIEQKPKGKIVGQTSTGKDIYSNTEGDHPYYKNFSSQDHKDAAKLHQGMATFGVSKRHTSPKMQQHIRLSISHSNAAHSKKTEKIIL